MGTHGDISIEVLHHLPTPRRRTELVERKGLGHPDTICDSIMESASVALSRAYVEACGRVLHHNLDKAMLVAGQATPRLGGGEIVKPMRLIAGDRATSLVDGRRLDVGEIVESAARTWLRSHLRFVDPGRHLVFQSELQSGSAELVDIFERPLRTANDTSAAVGYAPLTETECLVLETEKYLNSPELKRRFPEVGEDIKVMAFRRDGDLSLTIAAAFVDRFLSDSQTYFDRKEALRDDLRGHLQPRLRAIDALHLAINTLDDSRRGEGGMYLTVLGTSAESGDGGQVGRGNRVHGLISLHRPMSMEAAAGKNPVSHVGKIYNVLSHRLARRIHERVPGIDEVTVWLSSQIGRPLDDPWSVAVEIIPLEGEAAGIPLAQVETCVHDEIQRIPDLLEQLIRGELPVC